MNERGLNIQLSDDERKLLESELRLFKMEAKTSSDIINTIEEICKYKLSTLAESITMKWTKETLKDMSGTLRDIQNII